MDPAFRSRVGDDPADLLLSETSGTLHPLCALAESPGAGGGAAFSELKLLRKSRYCSLPLVSTGISSQSLSNWQRSRGHLPGLVANPQKWGRSQRRGALLRRGPGPTSNEKLKKEKHPSGCGFLGKQAREDCAWLLQDTF